MGTIGIFLHYAMDGRQETVHVIVAVKQYGLAQLQFEFASDIDAESQVGFFPGFQRGS